MTGFGTLLALVAVSILAGGVTAQSHGDAPPVIPPVGGSSDSSSGPTSAGPSPDPDEKGGSGGGSGSGGGRSGGGPMTAVMILAWALIVLVTWSHAFQAMAKSK